MKRLFNKIALTLCTVSLMNSCSLDEYNPAGGQGGDMFLTFDGWSGVQTYCYQPLYRNLYSTFDFLSLSEGGTDLWITSINKTWAQEIFYYEGLATNTSYTNSAFKNAYALISSCNSVINNATKLIDGDPNAIKVLVAETRCLRALYYSILVTHYGNITLNLSSISTDSNELNYAPQRSTYEELYKQIVDDLKKAAEDLGVEPYNNQKGRCTKKSALGLLARVYAQGAGEGLTENGKTYWERAKEVAEDLINNSSTYGASLYEDIEDLWAQANNKNNKEALLIAEGPDAHLPMASEVSYSNIFSFLYPSPYKLSDIYKTNDNVNYLYGRVNNNILAPSKYLIDLFDAKYDKRWEQTFTTAFGDATVLQTNSWWSKPTAKEMYDLKTVELTPELCEKYEIDPRHIGKKIYPYADYEVKTATWNQYVAKMWPKGDHSADIKRLQEVKNIYVNPYPLDKDEDRFIIYLSKERLSDAEKAERAYVCINIDDLFDEEGKYKDKPFDKNQTNTYMMYPGLIKFNWNYDGAFGRDMQKKTGDIFIMRMAEVYLIAAEACQQLGEGEKATEYINILRKRASRNYDDYVSHMKLTTPATEQDILDEYARELCGEFNRWALLKRHKAFENQLEKGNPRAARTFSEKNYLRPISYEFLNSISNAEEYGTNGY